MIRSPLRWAGSKRTQLGLIQHFIPKADYFIDLFGGSGVVTLLVDLDQ